MLWSHLQRLGHPPHGLLASLRRSELVLAIQFDSGRYWALKHSSCRKQRTRRTPHLGDEPSVERLSNRRARSSPHERRGEYLPNRHCRVAGNIGGCTALPWDLLSRSELDPSWTNFGARSHGPGTQSSLPRGQGYLSLPAEAQRAAAPLGDLTKTRRTYYVGEKQRSTTGNLSA
jgi:hypothetical protein